MLDNLYLGITTALQPGNALFCLIGVSLGTMIGVLPGIGPTATIAMLLPITLSLSPEASLIMLAGIYYGAQYGGSTTAILMNVPGESSAAITAVDGYQMARQGSAGQALAVAAISSFVAGTIATFVIVFAAPFLTKVAVAFQPAEYFSLMVLGITLAIALAHGSILLALSMVVFGLLLGMIGTDIYTAASRFTFGQLDLADGISFVALSVGIFGITEILKNLENESERDASFIKPEGLMPKWSVMRACILPILRATGLGSLLGTLPGGGATLSSFAAYTVEKKLSRTPERFGRGAIEGVAAPEAANNASAQTSFIPMLTLGIPSNGVMALMIGAMIIQGIAPGPNIITQQPVLFWSIICSMWVGNLLLVMLNLPLVGLWIKLLRIPYYMLFPTVVVFASIGVYSVDNSIFDVIVLAFFSVVGYILVKLECEPAPLLLGFVLGPMLEENLRRAMLLSRGQPMVLIERPISLALLVLALLVLLVLFLPFLRSKRAEVFSESE